MLKNKKETILTAAILIIEPPVCVSFIQAATALDIKNTLVKLVCKTSFHSSNDNSNNDFIFETPALFIKISICKVSRLICDTAIC